jgi:prepilin-type N-terminal cleavage/methylation domain-containing protein
MAALRTQIGSAADFPIVSGQPKRGAVSRGFSLVEMVVVMACLAIGFMIIAPTLNHRSSMQLSTAAEMLAGDLEFAQVDSMAHADDTRIFVIDLANNGYFIAAKSSPTIPITHPDKFPYLTRFGVGRAGFLSGVTINKYNFAGDAILGFGEQGDLDQATPATIEIGCAGQKVIITIDPLSGRATISNIQ